MATRDLTIEPSSLDNLEGECAVYEHSEYEESSVLAGQPKRTYIAGFNTRAEAIAAYPEAQVCNSSTKTEFAMSSSPPSWFDPTACGERW